MREISPNVWQLSGFLPNAINVYLIGDVLIDAATRWAGRRILRSTPAGRRNVWTSAASEGTRSRLLGGTPTIHRQEQGLPWK